MPDSSHRTTGWTHAVKGQPSSFQVQSSFQLCLALRADIITGKPPLWTPQKGPQQLKQDSGTYYRDKNAARYPAHPLEPAIIVALEADPELPSNLDIFCCASTLGNLLRFVRGENKQFRMVVYKLGRTFFFVRRENSPTEVIPDVKGYGHTFPEANTTWEEDVKGSGSHQRLVSYRFSGMKLCVRSEADGYIKKEEDKEMSTSGKATTNITGPPAPPRPSPTLESLATALDILEVTPPSQSPRPSDIPTSPTAQSPLPAGLKILRSYTPPIPQSHIFDLKTRSMKKRPLENVLLDEEIPRLWIRQLQYFILAYHDRGLFRLTDVEVKVVKDDVRKWELDHQRELGKFARVLRWVIDVAEEYAANEDHGIEICLRESKKLEARKVVGLKYGVASKGVREWWEGLVKKKDPETNSGEEEGSEETESTYANDWMV
jgi:hypothetical protein